MTYIGRFAPTPSGPLHFGSLIAATASYLDAKSQHGRWLLRIDDLDTPRVVNDATSQIITQLEAYGFEWDDAILYQSQANTRYQQALDQLIEQGNAFYCQCSRKQVFARQPDGLYDGHCREQQLAGEPAHSARFKVPNQNLSINDLIQGRVQLNPQDAIGDFVLKRSDGYFGYHLACALDDLYQQVTHVIRGYDLLSSSFAQSLISQALAQSQPQYGHHPVAVTHQQVKYSKSAHSPAIAPEQAETNLVAVLKFLNQNPPQALEQASIAEIWHWAIRNWNIQAIPACGMIEA